MIPSHWNDVMVMVGLLTYFYVYFYRTATRQPCERIKIILSECKVNVILSNYKENLHFLLNHQLLASLL